MRKVSCSRSLTLLLQKQFKTRMTILQLFSFHIYIRNKVKGTPVTGRAGQQGCETSRLPHFLYSRLTYDGKVVSLTCRLPFTPQEDSWYSFLLEAESTPVP
jgi:hypothetical protein